MSDVGNKIRQLLIGRSNSEKVRPKNTSGRGGHPSATGPRWAEPATNFFEEDKPPQKPKRRSRQVSRPFVTPYYIWGTLALLTAGFAAGALFLSSSDREVIELNEHALAFGDPLQPFDPDMRSVLLNRSPELAAELKRSFLGKPDALCAELKALGLENPGWKKAPFQRERWQCASDLVPLTTPSVDFGSTTLFFLLRGPSEEQIDYLRLKLVVEDPKQKQIGLDAVWLVIDALSSRYGWTVPSSFRQAIANFGQIETTHRGVQLSVAPEDPNLTGDPLADQRLNIIMNFGEPDLIRPADRFEQAPPLESGWSVRDLGDPEAE